MIKVLSDRPANYMTIKKPLNVSYLMISKSLSIIQFRFNSVSREHLQQGLLEDVC